MSTITRWAIASPLGMLLALLASAALAASSPAPALQQQGTVVIGNCLKSTGPNAAADSGVGCSAGVVNPTSVKLGAAPAPSGIDCIGDSLSAGYCAQLQSLMSGVVNNAVSGNSPFQIAARMGALPITMTSSTGFVGSSGGDVVTISDITPVTTNGPSGGVTGTWQGTHGTLTISGSTLIFTADNVAQKTALNAAPFVIDQVRTYRRRVVWMGHNVSQQPFTTIAGTWGLVAANTPSNTQLLFMLNTYDLSSGGVPAGNFGTETKLQNNYIQRTFPNTLDPTPILQAGANSSFPPDAADVTNGTEPSSLRLLDGVGTLTSTINNSTTSIPITVTSGVMNAGDEIVVENGTNAESMLSTATTGSTGAVTATVAARPCSSTIGSCSPALSHTGGAAVYIVNVIHFDSTTDGNYIAGQAAYQSNFPSANKVGGYNLLATGVSNWFTANAPPTPTGPVQSADTDGQIKASAGIVPASANPQSILGTLQKPYASVTANNVQVPGALKCTFSGVGGECDTANLYAGAALYVGGSPYASNLNTWFGCYVLSGTDYCTPLNGANVELGTSSNSFFFADLGHVGIFAYGISPDTNDFGSVGSIGNAFGRSYFNTQMAAGAAFTVSGSAASTPVGGGDAGKFTAGATGTNTVTITLASGNSNGTASHGWICGSFTDLTTNSDSASWQQTATTTTTATFTGTAVSGDVIQFACPRGY